MDFLSVRDEVYENWTISEIVEKACPRGWENLFSVCEKELKRISEIIEEREKKGFIIFPLKKNIFKTSRVK